MKKILVLGSEGFIGSHVIRQALKRSLDVYGVDIIDRTPENYTYAKLSLLSPDFDSLLSSEQFDVIFNCAGSGNVSFSVQHPISDFEANSWAVLHVLDAVRKYQTSCRYVHVSSAAVYGNPVHLPVSEQSSIQPVSPYGFHKWIAEISCREYALLYGLSIAVVRPFSVYGPGLQKQLLWDVFQKAKNTTDVLLWGTGEETRDFIYVEDLANALFAVAETNTGTGEIYNIASGHSVTIRSIVEQLFEKLGWQRKLEFNGTIREGDPRFWQADISKLTAAGHESLISLNEGLSLTATWLSSYDEKNK